MWHEFDRRNPFRPPHWRWERAGTILDGGPGLSRKRDDHWIQQAVRFRTAVRRCEEPLHYSQVAALYPELWYAHMIWEARSQQEREMLAHEVEARLLSGDTWAHTAARAGVDVPTIQAYEALFFNVADRLDQESYIYHQVMGRSLQEGVRERQYDLLWKMYGYRGGPIVLDMLVATTPTMPRCDTLDELKVWMEQQTQLQSTQKAMIAARTLDASNGFNQVEVIRTYAQLREMEANVDNKGKGATTALTANVEAMCRALPFSVGRQRPGLERSLTADSVNAYDGYEAELRGDEVMALSLGEEPPQLEQVKMLKFPPLPPPSKTPAPETA